MRLLKFIFFITCFLGILSFSPAGQLGQWQYTNSLNVSRSDNVAVLSRNTIVHTFGGYAYTTIAYPVERSTIRPDGSLSPWVEESTSMITARDNGVGFSTDSYVYAISGDEGPGHGYSTTAVRAPINIDGSLGEWTTISILPQGFWGSSLARISTYVYIIGCYPGSANIFRTILNPDGSLGTWNLLSSQLVTGRYDLMSIAINSTIYVVGGNYKSVERSYILPNGELSNFTTISNTIAFHNAGGIFFDGTFINVIGGYAGGALNYRSERARVNSDGSLSPWEPAPALQMERDFFGYVQTSTNSYVIGASEGGDSNSVEYVSFLSTSPPIFPNTPSPKLYLGQSLLPAFDLNDYNIGDATTTYSILNNFLSLSTLTGNTISQMSYTSPTSGTNIYLADNVYGEGTATNKVKYSTYKIHRLPQIVLRPNQSWVLNVGNYTFDSSNNLVIPNSFNQSDSLLVSDTTQLTASWANPSTITITSLSGFTNAQEIDIIASPQSTSPFGIDIDKEKIEIYPSLSTTAFEFTNSNDTGVFSYQIPSGASSLATIGYTTSVSDIHGGALQITFSSPSSGIKITPKFNTWLPNTPQSWYTLRVRVLGTNTANSYLQLLYNGNPGKSPTDIQGYFRYSVPTTWTYIDISINSFDSVSSSPVMYPQLVLKANGETGTIYIDELEIFQATPPLLTPRYKTSDTYSGGSWNDSSATTQWAIQTLSGTGNINVINGQLYINTTSTTPTSLKFTASTAKNTIYTVPTIQGNQAGMHMYTQLVSGSTNLSQTQIQLILLGTMNNGSFSPSGDISSAAEIGRISNRTLHLSFNPDSPFYQVQFIIKNIGTSSIQIDNTLADIQSDESNYGDASLFP